MVKLIISDIDGCITNGKYEYFKNGDIRTTYDTKDGLAVSLLRKKGIKVCFISGKSKDFHEKRMKDLLPDYYEFNVDNKLCALESILHKFGVSYNETAYFGDDDSDIQCLKKCYHSGCPSNSTESVKSVASFVCSNSGGNGALYEFYCHLSNDKICPVEKDLRGLCNDLFALKYIINTDQFQKVCKMISKAEKIVFCGSGKSFHVANLISSIFSSNLIPSFSLNISLALRGEIGSISKNDLVFILSKSGDSSEVNLFKKIMAEKNIETVLLTNNKETEDEMITFVLPYTKEYLSRTTIPASSTVIQYVFGLMLAFSCARINVESIETIHPNDFDKLF